MKQSWLVGAMALCCMLWAPFASGGDDRAWPERPVRFIVPFPPGGSTDAVARLVADRLSNRLGQQFVVENRPGAGGNIGTALVAGAAPDGYTLTLSTSGPLANNKFLYESLSYDPERDLSPVAMVGAIPLVVAVSGRTPVHDLKELIELFGREPGKYAVGNPGKGTIGHLAAELLGQVTNSKFISVPYKGDTPALNDLMNGSVIAVVAPVTAFIPHIRSGTVKGLAIMARERFPMLPEVPTTYEQGVEADAAVWFGVVGPANLPDRIVDRLNAEINLVLDTDEARSRLEQYGAVVVKGTAADMAELVRADSSKWEELISATGIRIE